MGEWQAFQADSLAVGPNGDKSLLNVPETPEPLPLIKTWKVEIRKW